ncbi:MAG: cell division protein SepF [Eubacteriales bacterium]
MAVVDKFLSFVKLNEIEDEYLDAEDEDEDEEIEEVSFRKRSVEEEKRFSSIPKVTPIKQMRKAVGSEGMEVVSIKPTSVEDHGVQITETLLANRPVLMNLEGLDFKVAQRIIDYASGSCYALHGQIQRVAQNVYILAPANVNLSGDVQELEEDESFGVQPLKELF